MGEIEGRLVFRFLVFSWFYEVLFTQRTLVEYREGWFMGFWSFHGYMKFCWLKEIWWNRRKGGVCVFEVFIVL